MPPGHNGIVRAARVLTPRTRTHRLCTPGRTIRNAGSACRTGRFETPVLRARWYALRVNDPNTAPWKFQRLDRF